MRIRQEYVGLAQQWLASAVPHLRRGNTRLDAGETSAHYPADVTSALILAAGNVKET